RGRQAAREGAPDLSAADRLAGRVHRWFAGRGHRWFAGRGHRRFVGAAGRRAAGVSDRRPGTAPAPRVLAGCGLRAAGRVWRSAPAHVLGYLAVTLVGAVAPIALAWLTKAVLDGLADR